jgi:hypothetical protein
MVRSTSYFAASLTNTIIAVFKRVYGFKQKCGTANLSTGSATSPLSGKLIYHTIGGTDSFPWKLLKKVLLHSVQSPVHMHLVSAIGGPL